MPPAKRAREEESLDSSIDSDTCDLESSTSSESLELDNSELDPELEADMEQYRKPDASYIELIAKAIMESPGQKLKLQDIYDTLAKKHPYFQVADPGWRNSIRHNLSLHECFCKTERCGSGKGHYWSIHPIHMQDFLMGDFRRRTVKSRARQLHQQQQKGHEAVAGALASLAIPSHSHSPSILSPVGQTHFHFPSPLSIGSPQVGPNSTVPPSPTLPSSPSLIYSPNSGVFFGSFPFTFVYGGAYPLSSFPFSPPAVGSGGSLFPFPPPTSYSPSSGAPNSVSVISASPLSSTVAPHLPSSLNSLPVVPNRPPILPPVCCINCPPAPNAAACRSDSSSTGTLTAAMSKSHTPHFADPSITMQDPIRQSTFSIDNILASD